MSPVECGALLEACNVSVSQMQSAYDACGCGTNPCAPVPFSATDYDLTLHGASLLIIFVMSMSGALIPLLATYHPRLRVDPYYVSLGKVFGTGIVMAAALVHLLQPATQSLSSVCVPEAINTDYTAYAYVMCLLAMLFMHAIESALRDMIAARQPHAPSRQSARRPPHATSAHAVPTESCAEDGAHVHRDEYPAPDAAAAVAPAELSSAASTAESREGAAAAPRDAAARARAAAEVALVDPAFPGDAASPPARASALVGGGSGDGRDGDGDGDAAARAVEQKPSIDSAAFAATRARRSASPPRPDGHGAGARPSAGPLAKTSHTHDSAHMSGKNISEHLMQAYLMEFALTTHSIFIGLTVGVVTVSGGLDSLLVALCFHQFFEGVALGSRLADAPMLSTLQMAIFLCIFAFSAPIGIAVGIGLVAQINVSGATYLLVEGFTDSFCAGLLLYIGFQLLNNDLATDVERYCKGHKHESLRVLAVFVFLWVGATTMSYIGLFL